MAIIPFGFLGDETLEYGPCWTRRSCGRHFSKGDITRAELEQGCPSDDCPSHWEEVGLEYQR